MVCICIGKQKVVWIFKLRENSWKAATSALSIRLSVSLEVHVGRIHVSLDCDIWVEA